MPLDKFVETFGYLGIFFLVFAMNVVPAFMPPTWMVLATFHSLYPEHFNPILLALTGAFASTFGRVLLCRIGGASRRLMGEDRKRSMDRVGRSLKSNRYGGFLLSFLFAVSPLPSNVYFLTVGMTRSQSFRIFLGFWLGRVISYWAMISLTHVAYKSLEGSMTSKLQTVIIIDSLGVLCMVLFALVDWEKLLEERRLVLIRPGLGFFKRS
jgi:uncharacterized membrane protein YdjX (TVP38/TMEM64 family)